MSMDKTSYKNFIIKNTLSFTAGILAFSILIGIGQKGFEFDGTQIINIPFYDKNVVGSDDITFQEEKEELNTDIDVPTTDFATLKSKYYTVDSSTDLLPSDIDVEKFKNMDLSIDNTVDGPKILIFHTHANEMYADSNGALEDGIWGVGEELKKYLEDFMGLEVIHDTGQYDRVNGKGQVIGAYERMEVSIQKILDENPSIQMVIDLHRDGVPENTHLVTEIDGKQCAKIMFFNGLCRLYENGSLNEISYLPNHYLEQNLALSFRMQTLAQQYEGFTRKIYVNAYRYSLHMKPLSMLVEVGAQTNTKQEAINSMYYLANIISNTITVNN